MKTGSTAWKAAVRRRLIAWYRRCARPLPWRRSRDPYRVWISEVMLQQTQVDTVTSYYQRFLARFPDVAALAGADEREVLRLWEGLGYYRRARQLHAAARQIVTDHHGVFPDRIELLRGLPGIGRYTAGAILSIAFDQREPILEANSLRVLSRLIAYADDPRRSAGQKTLWSVAQALLPRRHAGTFNQALMELGSLVCLSRGPRCTDCPLTRVCEACQRGLQHQIPPPAKPPQYEQLSEVAVVIRRGHRILLRQCHAGERWAGLWDFLRFPRPHSDINVAHAIPAQVHARTGLSIHLQERFAQMRYGVTRYRIDLDCYTARYAAGRLPQKDGYRWVPLAQLETLPLSVTGRRISQWLLTPGQEAAVRRTRRGP